jgi:hypothetical protein
MDLEAVDLCKAIEPVVGAICRSTISIEFAGADAGTKENSSRISRDGTLNCELYRRIFLVVDVKLEASKRHSNQSSSQSYALRVRPVIVMDDVGFGRHHAENQEIGSGKGQSRKENETVEKYGWMMMMVLPWVGLMLPILC